ncbi:helix-turn-helix domain-containing protein [Chryseobacterium oranimense]|uniref:helix-turn-helix domain-containing protein n=1 Tax=Chryseobacterium oranimense TaxID=421058 RepID=UPI0021AFDB24|nr:helix-turn-helix domain-containing protein [Chryseobacterium oranimense]UWX62064.1 helix-turn-helix domain-containing protein [Chryseobacterium oranimense]
MINTPNYKKIYTDILDQKYPQKIPICQRILNKKKLSTLDIIALNKIIFGEQDNESIIFNQRHRSYCEKTIIEILDYQKKYNLNNTQIALHFKMSRNSVATWKRKYLV